MNSFSPNQPGGGNLGFAVSIRTVVSIKSSEHSLIDVEGPVGGDVHCGFRMIAEHAVTVWRNAQNDVGGYHVTLMSVVPCHVGLASASALQTAIVQGLNWLNGEPLTPEQVRRLVAVHYREAGHSGLQLGFTTGLSSYLNLFGGFALVDSGLHPVYHVPLPSWQVAICSISDSHGLSSGASEADTLMGAGRALDREEGSQKIKVVREQLLPAIRAADIYALGSAVHAIQSLGSKRAEMALYGTRALNALSSLREEGVECAFLSAVGPGIVLISEMKHDRLSTIIQRCGLQMIRLGELDNRGIVITPFNNRAVRMPT